ncbi:MAG: MFS transporter [Steroidobacteraceae bacterium]
MLINFADKAVVGLASVPIMQELQLSHTQFGMLGSALFLLFFASGVTVGFLSNRFSTKTLMWIMGVVWSAALLPMSMASSFPLLVGSRVVLGAAEGPAFPVAVHAVYKWFANADRALPTSIVASGAAFGAGLVAPLIIWIIDHFGWHASFGTLGVVGLVWVVCWLAFVEEWPALPSFGHEYGFRQRVPYRHLLMSRTAVGFCLAGFAAYWIHTLAGVCAPLMMGRMVDINANPIGGFRTDYLFVGVLVATLGAVAAILINPEYDLRRFQTFQESQQIATH